MKIALLEDDSAIAETTIEWLRNAGYSVTHFTNGMTYARAVEQEPYDLCLIDWMVPDLSGMEVLSRLHLGLKDKEPPVIFISSRDSDEDIAGALSSGADDYVVKPVAEQVLLARIGAVMRRAGAIPHPAQIQTFGPLTVDFARREILVDGRRADLTEREHALAMHFFQNIGSLLSREHLIQVVWARNPGIDTRTVDVHISTLRRKLQLTAETGWRLVSVYRHGYRLEREEHSL